MALDFPNSPSDGQVYTDTATGEQWVYEAATNSWTSKGLVNTSGGLVYKGTVDITKAPPTASSGWQYSVLADGTANAGFGPGITGTVAKGDIIMYTGTGWTDTSHNVPQATAAVAGIDKKLWKRTGTELSPETAGDDVFTSGDVKVGGTTAAPKITVGADTTAPDNGIYSPGADQVAISTKGKERFSIDSDGRLLVGTDSWYNVPDGANGIDFQQGQQIRITQDSRPTGGLAVISASDKVNFRTADIALCRQDGRTDYAALSDGNPIGAVTFQGADGSKFIRAASISAWVDGTPGTEDMPGRLVFSTTADGASAPTERLRIDSNGLATFAGNIATTGVVFGTPSAPATSNTLDDYEEGIWTPAITFATPGDLSVTYTFQLGNYTRIGDLVTVLFRLTTTTFTHTTAAGALRITGLPFTASNTNPNYQGSAFSGFQGITNASFTQYSAIVLNNNSFLSCAKNGSGRGSTDLRPSDMPTGGTVILHGTVSYKAY